MERLIDSSSDPAWRSDSVNRKNFRRKNVTAVTARKGGAPERGMTDTSRSDPRETLVPVRMPVNRDFREVIIVSSYLKYPQESVFLYDLMEGVDSMDDTIGSLDVHDDDFGVSVQAYGSTFDCDGDGPALDGRCRGQAHCILGIH